METVKYIIRLQKYRKLMPTADIRLTNYETESSIIKTYYGQLPFYLKVEICYGFYGYRPGFYKSIDSLLANLQVLAGIYEVLYLFYFINYNENDSLFSNQAFKDHILAILNQCSVDDVISLLKDIPCCAINQISNLSSQLRIICGYVLAGDRDIDIPVYYSPSKYMNALLCHVFYWRIRNYSYNCASDLESVINKYLLLYYKFAFAILYFASYRADSCRKYIYADYSDYISAVDGGIQQQIVSFIQIQPLEIYDVLSFYEFASQFYFSISQIEKITTSFNLNYLERSTNCQFYRFYLGLLYQLDTSQVNFDFCASTSSCISAKDATPPAFVEEKIVKQSGYSQPVYSCYYVFTRCFYSYKKLFEQNTDKIATVCRTKDILCYCLPVLSQVLLSQDYATNELVHLLELYKAFYGLTNIPLPQGRHSFKNRYYNAFVERDLSNSVSSFSIMYYLTTLAQDRLTQAEVEQFNYLRTCQQQMLILLNSSELTANLRSGSAEIDQLQSLAYFFNFIGIMSASDQRAFTLGVFLFKKEVMLTASVDMIYPLLAARHYKVIDLWRVYEVKRQYQFWLVGNEQDQKTELFASFKENFKENKIDQYFDAEGGQMQ